MAKGRKDTTKERPSSPSSAKKPAGGKSVAASLVLNRSKQVPAEDTAAFGPIAERFRRAGNLERAVALCKEGLQKFPEHLSARVTLGWALLDLGRYDEAFEALQQVLKRAPDNLAAIRGMAELHERAENAVELPLDGPGPWPPDADAIEASASSTEEDEIEKALAAAGLANRTDSASAPAAAAVIPPAPPVALSSPTPAASSHPAGEIDLAHSATDSLRELEPFMPATPVVAEAQKPLAPPPVAASTPSPFAPPVEEAPVLLGSNGMPMASAPEVEPFVAHAPVLEPVMDEEVVPETTNFSKTEPLEAVIDDEIAPVEIGAEPFTAGSVEIGSADAAVPEEDPLDAFRLSPTPEFLATAEENVDPLLEAERAVAADGLSLDFEAQPVVDLGGYELTPRSILDAAANLDAASADEAAPVAVDPGPALDFDAPISAARAEDDFALTPAPILDESAAPEIVIDEEVGELSLGTDDQSLSLDFDAPEAVAEVAEPPAEVVEAVEVAAVDLAAAPEPVVDMPPAPVVEQPRVPIADAPRVPEPEPVFRTVIAVPEPPAPIVEAAPVQARVTPVLRSLTPPAQGPDPANDGSESLDVLSIVPPVLESKRKPLDMPAVRKTARRPPKSVAVLEGMLRGIAVRRIEMANERNQYQSEGLTRLSSSSESARPNWTGRLHALREFAAGRQLDAFVVSTPVNVAYLSGFSGSAGWLVVTAGDAWLITDGRYEAAVRQAAAADRLGPVQLERMEPRYDLTLAGLLGRIGSRTVGFEAGQVTVATLAAWQKAAPRVEWTSTDGVIERARMIKDAAEVATLRVAAQKLSDVARQLTTFVAAGRTEREIATSIDAALDRVGFSQPAFPTIVASGPNSALPHAHPTDRCLTRGDLVVLDFGGVLDGYCVDLTRTAGVGQVGSEAEALFAAVRDAQTAAIAMMRSGVAGSEVDAAARRVLEARGFGPAFLHSTGHGLGLEVHESPRLARAEAGVTDRLEAGMVCTVEPGAYLEGLGGVRLEDDVLVTAGGCEVLTDAPRDLLVV